MLRLSIAVATAMLILGLLSATTEGGGAAGATASLSLPDG